MRFTFHAVDAGGRVVRGVMRADDEGAARESLLGEELYAKKLEPAPEETPLTWAPKRAILAARAAPSSPATPGEAPKIERHAFETVALHGLPERPSGTAGISPEGDLVFVAGGRLLARVRAAQVESAAVAGFPSRLLRVVQLDGKMFEFAAGFLLANAGAKGIARELAGGSRR